MANSTTEFWSADGVSLQTFARNISTWGGDKEAPPRLRGEDIQIAYRPGRQWTPKLPDSRRLGLKGWVIAANPDGDVYGDDLLLRQNWRQLRALLWRDGGEQFDLTKRWYDEDADLIRVATARAEFISGLEPRMTGPRRAEWDVDLNLADPFFYGTEETIELSIDAVSPNPGPSVEIPILGNATTLKVHVDLVGPLTDAKITVTDLTPQPYVRYLDLPDGSVATLDVDRFRVIETDGALTDLFTIGKVVHDGDVFWLPLKPGTRTLVLTATAGTGTATIRYQPAWI
jgi:hypothetical protein